MRRALPVPRSAARRRAAALVRQLPRVSRARGVLRQPEVRARLALGALWSPPGLMHLSPKQGVRYVWQGALDSVA